MGPRNHVRWGAHWHNQANVIEPSMSGGGCAAFLSNYFDHLSLLGCIAHITYVEAACCYRSSIVVCQSVGQSVTLRSPAKTAEPIEMPFGLRTQVSPSNHVVDGVQVPHGKGHF